MEHKLKVPKTIKDRSIVWSSNSTSGYVSEESINTILKRYMYPMFIAALLTIVEALYMEATWMCIDRWMVKEDVVHIYNGILLSHKKEHIWVSTNEGDEPRTYYTE